MICFNELFVIFPYSLIFCLSILAAFIQQCVKVKNKDIRKFLDGVYVSEKGPIVKD